MIDLVILFILVAAFVCEMINTSLGMLYGTILSPVLIISGFDPLVIIPVSYTHLTLPTN